jgi:hypothetical protein
LGRVSRLTGHRRVPEPPARITGTSTDTGLWSFHERAGGS